MQAWSPLLHTSRRKSNCLRPAILGSFIHLVPGGGWHAALCKAYWCASGCASGCCFPVSCPSSGNGFKAAQWSPERLQVAQGQMGGTFHSISWAVVPPFGWPLIKPVLVLLPASLSLHMIALTPNVLEARTDFPRMGRAHGRGRGKGPFVPEYQSSLCHHIPWITWMVCWQTPYTMWSVE